MQVFNVICQVIFYGCLAFSLGMFIYYKIRQHHDRKKKLSQLQQEDINQEVQDNDKERNSKDQ